MEAVWAHTRFSPSHGRECWHTAKQASWKYIYEGSGDLLVPQRIMWHQQNIILSFLKKKKISTNVALNLICGRPPCNGRIKTAILWHSLTSLLSLLSTGYFPSQLCPLEEIHCDQQRVSCVIKLFLFICACAESELGMHCWSSFCHFYFIFLNVILNY